MTVEQRQSLLDGRFGICPICLGPAPEHVDHDHETGRVRAYCASAAMPHWGSSGIGRTSCGVRPPTWKETCGSRNS
nr:endonuclease domain-containing protein [Streptomyces qinglanensis]